MDKYVCPYCGECPGCVAKIHELETINSNLRGHIRRLEKSNEDLGLENHKLKGRGQGWNQNV